jgi:hypothetical protein
MWQSIPGPRELCTTTTVVTSALKFIKTSNAVYLTPWRAVKAYTGVPSTAVEFLTLFGNQIPPCDR